MAAPRLWLERHPNLVFVSAIAAGLVVPYVDRSPNWIVMTLLAGMIFFGCAKISLTELKEIRASTGLWFYGVRYLLAPALTFFALKEINFPVAAAALLILVAPGGMAAPAITALIKGNVVFSLIVTVASNVLFVLLAPPYLKIVLGQEIPINGISLFVNLLCMVAAPLTAFGILRWRWPRAVTPIKTFGSSCTVVLVFLTIMVVVAKLRSQIFANPLFVVTGFFWIAAIYALSYLVFGWALGKREPLAIRKAMGMTSGVNNIALAIVLSVLYFPLKVQLLMIIGEVVWILGIPAFNLFISRVSKENIERSP